MVKMYDFRVMGRADFPLDMLRYDSCYPTDGGSAEKISFDFLAGEDEYHKWRKNIRVISLRSARPPTTGRWSSFGWEVVNEKMWAGVDIEAFHKR